jgi:hypothetical protein
MDWMVPLDNAELPFLVTHWLANLHHQNPRSDNEPNEEGEHERARRRDAIRRIRQAASDLASAFEDLGAFGVASRVRVCCVEYDSSCREPSNVLCT